MRTLITTSLLGTVLLLAACGPPAEDPGAPTGEETATEGTAEEDTREETAGAGGNAGHRDALDLDAVCENPADGYRVHHPSSWYANDGDVTAACRVFDVEVPDIAPDTVLPLASSVLLTVEDHSLEEMRALIDDDPATEVHDLVETDIGDRAALRVDGHATGEAYLDAGVEVHRTYLALEGRTLVAAANELGEPALDTRRELLADMLATVEAVAVDDASPDDASDGEDVTLIGEPGRHARSGGEDRGELVDVRVGEHDGFTRVVLEFEAEVPAYEVAPTEAPIRTFPAGEDLEMAGTDPLEIVTSGTRVDLTGTEAETTYDGPLRFEDPATAIADLAMAGDHHGQMTWVIGLDREAGFAVAELAEPGRIVVDVVHEG